MYITRNWSGCNPSQTHADVIRRQKIGVPGLQNVVDCLFNASTKHFLPSRPVHGFWAMTTVWRISGKIIRSVLCLVVYDSWTSDTHTHEQFLKMTVGLGLGSAFCVFFWFSLHCFVLVLFVLCCVRFSFLSTKARDWLGRTSPKWPILYRLVCGTLTRTQRQNLFSSLRHFGGKERESLTPVNITKRGML